MWEMLVIAFFVCVVEKTGFLCDERLTDLLYIKDGNEEQSPSTNDSITEEEEGIEPQEEKIKYDSEPVAEDKVQENLSDNNLNSFEDIDFSGFGKTESTSSGFDDIQINKDALFGEGFIEEEEPPLMEDLNDIAASILSDIYGG